MQLPGWGVNEILRGVDYVTDDPPSHLWLASLAALLLACERQVDEWEAFTDRIEGLLQEGAPVISASSVRGELGQLMAAVVQRHSQSFSAEHSNPLASNISRVLPAIYESDELLSVLLQGDSLIFSQAAVVRPLIQDWIQTPHLPAESAHAIASTACSWTRDVIRPSLYDDSLFCEQVSDLPLLCQHFALARDLLLEAYGPKHTEWLAMQISYCE